MPDSDMVLGSGLSVVYLWVWVADGALEISKAAQTHVLHTSHCWIHPAYAQRWLPFYFRDLLPIKQGMFVPAVVRQVVHQNVRGDGDALFELLCRNAGRHHLPQDAEE
uniref:(northern house mosquito) hypothetical protein n=1 Tax=Culex pipiens TaxID=7175 RepID=A0A8D8KU95_CULPI